MPILVSDHKEKEANGVLSTIIDTLAEQFDKSVEAVFAAPISGFTKAVSS